MQAHQPHLTATIHTIRQLLPRGLRQCCAVALALGLLLPICTDPAGATGADAAPAGTSAVVATRQVVVTHLRSQGKDQIPKVVGGWNWLELNKYYAYTQKESFQPAVTPGVLLNTIPSGDIYIVREINAEKMPERELKTYDGMVISTSYSYAHSYHYDVQELYPVLTAETAARRQSPGTPAGALLEITTTEAGSDKELKWYTNKMEDVLLINSYLRDLPLTKEREIPTAQSVAIDKYSFRIKKISKTLKSFPDEVRVGPPYIRITRTSSWTRPYLDKLGFAEMAVDQKKLADYYKSIGINTPPRTY